MALSCQKEIQNRSAVSSIQDNVLSNAIGAGDVYTINNSRIDDKVFHFNRAANGKLTLEGKYSTQGKGTGLPLGSQGAVMLSNDKHWLFTVSAGTNEISVFHLSSSRVPQLVDKVSSQGVMPISIAVHGSLLYVLNASTNFRGSIAGYKISGEGKLTFLRKHQFCGACSNIFYKQCQRISNYRKSHQ